MCRKLMVTEREKDGQPRAKLGVGSGLSVPGDPTRGRRDGVSCVRGGGHGGAFLTWWSKAVACMYGDVVALNAAGRTWRLGVSEMYSYRGDRPAG